LSTLRFTRGFYGRRHPLSSYVFYYCKSKLFPVGYVLSRSVAVITTIRFIFIFLNSCFSEPYYRSHHPFHSDVGSRMADTGDSHFVSSGSWLSNSDSPHAPPHASYLHSSLLTPRTSPLPTHSLLTPHNLKHHFFDFVGANPCVHPGLAALSRIQVLGRADTWVCPYNSTYSLGPAVGPQIFYIAAKLLQFSEHWLQIFTCWNINFNIEIITCPGILSRIRFNLA